MKTRYSFLQRLPHALSQAIRRLRGWQGGINGPRLPALALAESLVLIPLSTRRAVMAGLLLSLVANTQALAVAVSPSTPVYRFPFIYHFVLTQGAGQAVCQANLKRLNEAIYTGPPDCDQPQTTPVPGFTALHRVPLSAHEVYTLFPRVMQFMGSGKQGSKAQEEAGAAERKRLGYPPFPQQWTLQAVKELVRKGQTTVWRYDPAADIDNDGHPTNLILWQGVPVGASGSACGAPSTVNNRDVYSWPQVAFVLDPGDKRIDTRKSEAIFGHPGGNYRFRGKVLSGFEPQGLSIDLFEYRGLYYFDTFLHWWDVQNPHPNARALSHTLAVFLRRRGTTREVCQYHMTKHRIPSQ